jgi:hypothetical protein
VEPEQSAVEVAGTRAEVGPIAQPAFAEDGQLDQTGRRIGPDASIDVGACRGEERVRVCFRPAGEPPNIGPLAGTSS